MISDDLNWTLSMVEFVIPDVGDEICHQLDVTNIIVLASSDSKSYCSVNHQCNGTNSFTGILFLTFYSLSSFEVVQRPFNIRPVRNSNNAWNTHYEFVYVNFIPYLTCFPTCLVIWLSCDTYDNVEVTWAQHVIPIWRCT